MTVVSGRRYLQRAMELGFQEVDLLSPDGMTVCREPNRVFLWMPWSIESAVKHTSDTIDIDSTAPLSSRKAIPVTIPHSPTPMATTNVPSVTATAISRSKQRMTNAPSKASVIEQCQSLRTRLRELLAETNELIRSAKRQRQSERLVRTTLASLKQLQTVA